MGSPQYSGYFGTFVNKKQLQMVMLTWNATLEKWLIKMTGESNWREYLGGEKRADSQREGCQWHTPQFCHTLPTLSSDKSVSHSPTVALCRHLTLTRHYDLALWWLCHWSLTRKKP